MLLVSHVCRNNGQPLRRVHMITKGIFQVPVVTFISNKFASSWGLREDGGFKSQRLYNHVNIKQGSF